MENQKKILLRINRDEIYFSCEGYSEEFINTISDVINQKKHSLLPVTTKPVEDKKTETSKEHINGSKKIYKHGEKERIIEDIRNEFSFEEINKKYNISKATYYHIKKDIGAEAAADKSSKDSAAKISTANNGSSKHRKGGFNPTSVSEEDKLNIAKDIKLGLFSSQILKKYHINIHAYSEIKKSIKMEKHKSAADEDDIESVKKRLDYGGRFDGDYSEVSVSKIDINKVQEKIHEKPLGSLAVNPGVRQWQKDMIARGL
ncbi:MAG: hypothetical protein M0Z72_04670 [Deltaproteobacteria bacterium]|nr:hypothetical protein [Deltaproteobacteria bacterium]